MPDPATYQSLYDALMSALSGPPPTSGWYDALRDFQPITAAVVAVCGGIGTAVIAYLAAMISSADKEKDRTAAKEVALVERNRRKLGSYLRLKSQLDRFQQDTSYNAKSLKASLDVLDQTEPLPKVKTNDPTDQDNLDFLDTVSPRKIDWKPEFFPPQQLDELEKAWKNIDLFPAPALRLLDLFRDQLHFMQDYADRFITRQIEYGKISDIIAQSHYGNANNAVDTARQLIQILEDAIPPLQERTEALSGHDSSPLDHKTTSNRASHGGVSRFLSILSRSRQNSVQ
jgi:hypothetical protein